MGSGLCLVERDGGSGGVTVRNFWSQNLFGLVGVGRISWDKWYILYWILKGGCKRLGNEPKTYLDVGNLGMKVVCYGTLSSSLLRVTLHRVGGFVYFDSGVIVTQQSDGKPVIARWLDDNESYYSREVHQLYKVGTAPQDGNAQSWGKTGFVWE